MITFWDAFISYGRADSKEFCVRLHHALLEQGLKVWFDQNDIPSGVDYEKQIKDGIDKSHNFLFIISPHSVNSTHCRKEIELAIKRNKRIIPILHVEEISRETWQQRNPKGTDEDWAIYQAKGLNFGNDRNPNMHPIIASINWLNMEEGLDEQKATFKDLLELFESHKNYVHNHTYFLYRALHWEQHQKQTQYLLVGEERVNAETWLKVRLKNNKQSPCEPTDLHCEFICESIKNANNLMTQVFMSYGEADKEMMLKLAGALMRESFTVWTNKTDIQTGMEFQEAINRGIEEANNVLYLISPDSLKSVYCQQEIDYALSLNKRIIPLLICETNESELPAKLKKLQFIDFTDNRNESDYKQDVDKLLKVLREDASYYEQHKMLLTKALKWKQQNRNTSILLRGYNLRQAEGWLKTAQQQRSLHPPLPIQDEFIRVSLSQPEDATQEVFISYSRVDSDFARRLNDALQQQGKTTWFDQESIASGADFQQEIERGIENSANFLFIISPSSVKSPYCANEVERAAELNRRIVPVLYRAVPTSDVHPKLASVQWVDFNQHNGEFHTNFSDLVRTLDTDREHVRNHTKWSQRSLEWEQNHRSEDLLLRGNEFAVAEAWLQETEEQQKNPPATELQTAYLQASRDAIKATKRRKTIVDVLVRSLMVVASVAAIMAGIQLGQARRNEIQALASLSGASFASGNQFDALMQGLRAARKFTHTWWERGNTELESTVMTALQQPLYPIRERNKLEGHNGQVNAIAFSPTGQMIATASADATARLWSRNGSLIRTLEGHARAVNAIAFSLDGQMIATASDDKTARLWNADGSAIAILPHKEAVVAVAFSPNGQAIATASEDGTARLWRPDGTLLKTLSGNNDALMTLTFSPDGQRLVTGDSAGKAILWQTEDGSKLAELPHGYSVTSIAFSQDSQTIVTGSRDSTVKLWHRDGTEIPFHTESAHTDWVNTVAISPDGRVIASGGDDRQVILRRREGDRVFTIATLQGFDDVINDVGFSPDGKTLAVASADNRVKLWKLDTASIPVLAATLTGHTDGVTQVRFSPQSDLIATASQDRTVRLWSPANPLSTTFTVDSLQYSPTGQTFVTAILGQPVRLYKANGQEIATLTSELKSVEVQFSHRGQSLVTIDDSGKGVLWRANGREIATLFDSSDGLASSIEFSADDQWILIEPYSALPSPNADRLTDEGVSEPTDVVPSSVLQLWTSAGKRIREFAPNTERYFSHQGHHLVTVTNGAAMLWGENGDAIATLVEQGDDSTAPVNIVFSPDDQVILTAVEGGVVQLWSIDGRAIATLIQQTTGAVDFTFSPDRRMVLTQQEGGAIQLWGIKGEVIATLMEQSDSNVTPMFSPDSRTIVLTQDKKEENTEYGFMDDSIDDSVDPSVDPGDQPTYGPVELWHIQPGVETANEPEKPDQAQVTHTTLIEKNERQGGEVLSVQFSPDGKILTTTIGYPASSPTDQLEQYTTEETTAPSTLNQPSGKVLLWQPDGTLIATLNETISWSEDGQGSARPPILNFPPASSEPDTSEVETSPGPLIFNETSQTFFAPTRNGSVKLWGYDGHEIKTLIDPSKDLPGIGVNSESKTITIGSENSIKEVKLSPDDSLIVTATSNAVQLLRPDGTTMQSLEGITSMNGLFFNTDTFGEHEGIQTFIDFSPNHDILALKYLKDLRLFQLDGTQIGTIPDPSGIEAWAFSPDNRLVAVFGKDGKIHLWGRDRQLMIELAGKVADRSELHFSPGNTLLISVQADETRATNKFASSEMTIRNLQGMMSLDTLMQQACAWVGDYVKGSSPELNQRDRHLCDDISPPAEELR